MGLDLWLQVVEYRVISVLHLQGESMSAKPVVRKVVLSMGVARIFYVEECESCSLFVRDTPQSGWRKITKIDAKQGDRVIVGDKEYIVEADLSRRKLNSNERPLWDGMPPLFDDLSLPYIFNSPAHKIA